jgi:ribosomal protein L29
MPKTTVRDLGDSELLEELARRRHELFELRFKRQIARILTELREREIAAAELRLNETKA